MHAVGNNDDGIGAPVPPKFSQCTFENVRILGKSLDHDVVVTDVPAVELAGFDVPGYEVEEVEFVDCCMHEAAVVKFNNCKRVCMQISTYS